MAKEKCTVQGHSNIVLVDATNTFDSASERDRWEAWSVVEGRPLSQLAYSNGTPALRAPQNYQDMIVVAGAARCYPSWNFLTTWWPRLLHGGTLTNGTAYPAGSTPLEWYAQKYDGVETRQLNNLTVASFVLSAAEGGPVMLDMILVGKTAASASLPGTLPSLPEAALDDRLLFSGSDFVYNSESYAIDSFSIEVNHLITPKYWNSTTAQCLKSAGRVVNVSVGMPWNSDTQTDFHRGGDTGFDLSLTLESGTATYNDVIELNQVKWGDSDPVVQFDGEMPFGIAGTAHESGTPGSITPDIQVTHNPAP